MSEHTTEPVESEVDDDSSLNVSSSPHIFSNDSVPKIMWTVFLALSPAVAFSVWHFGAPALTTLIIGTLSAIIFEALTLLFRGRSPAASLDGSAALTGLLLAMCLPPSVPAFMPIVGSFIAVVVAKHSMGGLGHNIFNPAHIGRAALMVSWPVAMTTWTSMKTVDAVTTATPLNILKQQGYEKLVSEFGSRFEMYKDLFLGLRNGCIGETSTLLLVLGGIYLIYRGYIYWAVPATMIGTVGALTWVFGPSGMFSGDPLFHMMAGGLVIGAFFMATDMVTTPVTKRGQILFAAGCGAITVLIRLVGGYPEGVCYSILLMNSVTPLIDSYMKPKGFGR